MTTPPAPTTRPDVPAWKLVLTLAVAGVLAGLLLVFVDLATRDAIAAHKRQALKEAIQEVLGGPKRVASLSMEKGEFVLDEPTRFAVDARHMDRVFVGYAEDGSLKGFAIVFEKSGFQDKVRVIFGYDALAKTVLGMKILESMETPGLGDKIEEAPFRGQFEGASAPLLGVKVGRGTGAKNEIDMVTGATISSKAVIDIINSALGIKMGAASLAERAEAWQKEAGR